MLSWFHALIQERRKYIPQGWSQYYEFSFGDLKAGELTLTDVAAESRGSGPEWPKIYGILENAIYGGRVANDFDLRVLRAYIAQTFNDSVLNGKEPLFGTIAVPQSGNVRDFTGLINRVPEIDVPALFGLPDNIDRSVQRFNSSAVIAALKQLAAASAEELRFDRAKWSQQLGPICELWANSYEKQTFDQVQITPEQLDLPDPIEAFVYMEIAAVKEILNLVDESVAALKSVLQGSGMLTAKSQRDATDLLTGAVPSQWCTKWEGPANPTQWIRVLNKKATALLGWVSRLRQNRLLETPIDLGDLFHPETFLNALRQKSARKLKTAIDELKLISSFEADKVRGQHVVQLDGFWLQGSAFADRRLVDIREQGATVAEVLPLPPCYAAWVHRTDAEPHSESSTARLPVYHALDREKLLCTLAVSNSGGATTRTLAGAAMFLAGAVA